MDPENLPIITHDYIANMNCSGRLIVQVLEEARAEILCYECGAVILSDVAVEDVEVVMDLMLRMPRDPKKGSRWVPRGE